VSARSGANVSTGTPAGAVSARTPSDATARSGANASAGTRTGAVSAGTPGDATARSGANASAGTQTAGGSDVSAGARPGASMGATRPGLSSSTAPGGRDVVPPDVAAARADVAAGRFDAALAKATTSLAREPASGTWLLVRGDALRGLGRIADAADAYEAAAAVLADADKLAAAYTAAYVRFHDLHDGARALAELADITVPSSPFEERGLALRVQILVSLKRAGEARDAARAYLGRYPHGDLRAYMMRVQQAP
jgi:hypothetical protein